MANTRSVRVAEQIKKALGHIIQLELKDPRIGFITITKVDLTTDLKFAKVYVSILGDEKNKKSSLIALNRSKSYMKSEIGKRLKLREVPVFSIVVDESLDYVEHIDNLLNKVKKEQ